MDADPNWFAKAATSRRELGSRWSSFGPYYAMFPVSFARDVIAEYTDVGDGVLDPFAGRATSLFCAREGERHALGMEISPLGWIYGRTKLSPASSNLVVRRLDELHKAIADFEQAAEQLPEFFHYCFSFDVRCFLLAARSLLRWRTNNVDQTLMAFILTYLHGKIENGRPMSLSNQMRQTKAMAPDYSIRWWTENGMAEPPEVDPVQFLRDRVNWRYAKGVPSWGSDCLRLGDCRRVLPQRRAADDFEYKLLLTSPPYRGVTSYYYDQWLRYWLLGEPDRPILDGAAWKQKYENAKDYTRLLRQSFGACRRLLSADATVYVRTDARPATLDITCAVLEEVFPGRRHLLVSSPYKRATQTSLFGDRATKPGEVDIIITD